MTDRYAPVHIEAREANPRPRQGVRKLGVSECEPKDTHIHEAVQRAKRHLSERVREIWTHD